ncbi:MAG: preprotein translocase subunit SecE [Phycisphaerales bacterium]
MNWTIYKPGQGYWTRLISGLAGGVLVLAGAKWLWSVIEGFSLPYGIYIQAASVVTLIAVCGLLLFKWVAVKPNTTDFLIATEGEMKKVNWPSKRETTGSTWIVIVALFLLVAILFFSDLVFLTLFRTLRILDI